MNSRITWKLFSSSKQKSISNFMPLKQQSISNSYGNKITSSQLCRHQDVKPIELVLEKEKELAREKIRGEHSLGKPEIQIEIRVF